MPATPYTTFAKMQRTLKDKRPELDVVTTEEEYNEMLKSAVFPSKFTIEMANADGKVVSGLLADFAAGRILNLTEAEQAALMLRRRETGKQCRDFEIKSMQDLGEILGKEGVNLVDLTQQIEGGAADGYLFETGANAADAFVGVQVTFANKQKNNLFSFCKSKEEIVSAVIDHQFILIGMFYDEDQFCGARNTAIPPSQGRTVPKSNIASRYWHAQY